MKLICHSLLVAAALSSCVSTLPTAQQMDALEQQVRNEQQPAYQELEQRRAAGQITQADYEAERTLIDHRVRTKVDSLVWSRHALAQSDLRSQGIPTPENPVFLEAPGSGAVNGSLYSSSRVNGLGNQVQGNMMRDLGGSNFNERRAGSIYDPQ